jgi:hypothetical protein
MFRNILALIIAFSALANLSAKEVDFKSIMKAMKDEMNRSLKELSIEGLEKPYYLEYKIQLRQPTSISSYLGNVVDVNDDPLVVLNVDLRIGNYKFDNSNYLDLGFSFFGSTDDEESYKNRKITLQPDYASIRRELWLATDAAYKQSNELYSKKLASLKNKTRIDTTEDFYPLPPIYILDSQNMNDLNYLNNTIPYQDIENLTNSLSAIFKNYPKIFMSSVSLESNPEITIYMNSEGREYIKSSYYIGIEAVATTQANDGLPVNNYYTYFANNKNEIPDLKILSEEIKKLCENTSKITQSKSLDEPYIGPVIFEDKAAGEVIAQNFASNLVASRQPLSEGGVSFGENNTNFQNKIGGRVLPEFMSVSSNPKLKVFNNTPLVGGFEIDDDGNSSQEVLLVKDGFLKTLLSSRIPTKRVKNSNGNRNGGGAMYSILKFDAKNEKKLSKDDLKKKMLSICKDRDLPYGFIVRKTMNQNIQATTLYKLSSDYSSLSMSSPNSMMPIEIFKIYQDGREELIKGAKIKGISSAAFKDILFTSNEQSVYKLLTPNTNNPYSGGGSHYILASIIAPDLLFEDIEIAPIEEDLPKPPYISKPN